MELIIVKSKWAICARETRAMWSTPPRSRSRSRLSPKTKRMSLKEMLTRQPQLRTSLLQRLKLPKKRKKARSNRVLNLKKRPNEVYLVFINSPWKGFWGFGEQYVTEPAPNGYHCYYDLPHQLQILATFYLLGPLVGIYWVLVLRILVSVIFITMLASPLVARIYKGYVNEGEANIGFISKVLEGIESVKIETLQETMTAIFEATRLKTRKTSDKLLKYSVMQLKCCH